MSEEKKTGSVWRVVLITLAVVLVLAIIGAAVLAVGLMRADQQVDFVLNGQPQVQLSYGESWEPEGVTVQIPQGIFHDFLAENVHTDMENAVDLTKPGTYRVVYRLTTLRTERQLEQTVTVTDTTLPIITLVGSTQVVVPVGQTYQEEGYTAADDLDGDITDRVIRTETENEITYTVSDSSGNQTTVSRTVTYVDEVPPVITLLGEQTVSIPFGTPYEEPGFAASDNWDGDLSGLVAVEGTVDPFTAGIYEITYTVSDAAGNTAQVIRKVEIKAYEPPAPQPTDGKVIYLTFDDGPGPYTSQLLDVLAKYDVKATFFVVNTGYLKLLPRMVAEGHSVGIHSMTHVYNKIYVSEETYFADLYGMQKIIRDYTGVTTTLMRFPGGSSNKVSVPVCPGIMTRLTKDVVAAGFSYFDWNADSHDASDASTADQVFQNVVREVGSKKTAVVLQHDIKKFSVEAVERIIQWGLENGYTFLPLEPDSFGAHHRVNN